MTAVYIIAGIIAFLGLLCILPVSVRIKFDREFVLKVYYARIKVFDTGKGKPEKHKKDHEKKEKSENPDKQEKGKKEIFIVKDFHRMGKIEFIKYYAAVLKDVLGKLLGLIKHFRVRVFDLTLAVAGEDAHTTAVQFGIVSAAVNPILLFFFKHTKVRAKKINIYADFIGSSYIFETDINLSVALIFLLISAGKLLKIYKQLENGTYETASDKKDTEKKESVKTNE